MISAQISSGESASRSSVCATIPSVEFSTGTTPRSARAAVLLGRALERHLTALAAVPPAQLVASRYQRYRRLGTDLPAV